MVKDRRDELRQRFRKVAWGRLTWVTHFGRRTQFMDSDDVAIVRDGTMTIHYKTLAAFIEDLEEAERLDREVKEMLKS